MRLKSSKSPTPASITARRCSRSFVRKHRALAASKVASKLPRQPPPCLRLVIVRVGDEMDLDTPLVAAHCGTRARAPE